MTVSAAFGCPFEGEIAVERVVEVAQRVAEARPFEIALADTIGVGVPTQVTELVSRVREAVPGIPLRCHFHNTRNTGFANAFAALQAGVRTLDASLGGIGGCPFAPAATGNIATEDLLYQAAPCRLPDRRFARCRDRDRQVAAGAARAQRARHAGEGGRISAAERALRQPDDLRTQQVTA